MSPLPQFAREVRLASRPDGLPRLTDFAVVEAPLATLDEGEVLVRNRFFHVFASLRMMIGGGAENVEGVPFPAVQPGEPLVGGAVGEVVAVGSDTDGLRPGDRVFHWRGWREFAAVPAAGCVRLGDEFPDLVTHLEQGWTAYAALTRAVEIRPTDTVFVTAGASAIGSMAGQIARLLGAKRVIGSTSSTEKAKQLVDELGYDAAVIRGRGPIVDQLLEAAPDGIDVLFDNVGGEQLQAAVTAANTGARFVLIGALSGQLAAQGTGIGAPVVLDSFQLLLKKIEIRGFSADDLDGAVHGEWIHRFADWLRDGQITFPHVRVVGIDKAPQTLLEVIEGRYTGTVVIEA